MRRARDPELVIRGRVGVSDATPPRRTSSTTPGRSTRRSREEMRRDERVWIMGQDVGRMGGVFGVTRGLYDEFGAGRVRDTTINETFIVGGAVGAAMTGHDPGRRAPVRRLHADRRRRDLPQARQVALHARRQALACRWWCACRPASLGGAGAEHSQCLEALAMHIPGLKVVAAGHPRRRQGPAEDRDPRPQPGALLRAQGPLPGEGRGARATTSSSCPSARPTCAGAAPTSPSSPPA